MNTKYLRVISILMLLLNGSIEAANVDSLKRILAKNSIDTNRVIALESLTETVYSDSPDSAIRLMEEAKAISEKINFSTGIASSYGWLAYLYEQQGNIDKALDYYFKSLALFQKLNNQRQIASCYNNIAAIYKDRGMINVALDYNNKSLSIKKQLKDSAGISDSYNNIGLILSSQGKISEALEYYLKALNIYELNNDVEGIATSLQNIAFVYKSQHQFNEALMYFRRGLSVNLKANDKYGLGYSYNCIGGLYEDLNNYDSALYYYNEALTIRTSINDKPGSFYSLKNISIVNLKTGKHDEAKAGLQKCFDGFKELDNKWGLAIVTNKLGEIYLDENINESEKYLKQSLQLAQELGYPAEIRNAAGNLQLLYRKKNDWKQALTMNDLFIKMRDSILNDDNRKASIKTQFKYEYEKKEAILKKEQEKKDALAASEIKRQLIFRNAIAAGFVLVILFAIVVYRQRNKIAKAKQRSDELLLNILPFEVAEELKLNGYAEAKNFDSITILFTDFKGFTQLSETMSAKKLVAEIDFCFSQFDKIISKYNIEKIKTIGDAYMCAGGLPEPNTTHAIDVINAAIDIRNFILQHKQNQLAKNEPAFEIRIGIHTGPAVAGIVGIKKFSYDIWGDTVNTAARMESSGEVGKVNISETTYELVKEKFNCEYRGEIEAKGKGKVKMYFVESNSFQKTNEEK